MKNLNNTTFINRLRSNVLMLIAGSSMLTSCVIYTGGYSETDGVYYDPNKDSLPAGSYANGSNQVDNYYNYQDTYPSIYDNNQQNLQDQQSRYALTSDSDWGTYTGTETNYTSFNNWGYGGFGFGYGGFGGWGYPGYGMYGWNSPFNSYGWGLGFGWGNSFYSPWGWGGMYDPFYGYGYGWGNYYGGGYHGGYYQPVYYNRSGSNGRLSGMISQNRSNSGRFQNINSTSGMRVNNNGFRNQAGNYLNNESRNTNSNSSMRNSAGTRGSNNGMGNFPNNGMRNSSGYRQSYPNNTNTRTQNYPNNGGMRTSPSNSGFRNESYNAPMRSSGSGGFNSGGGGGFRSGGSSGGGGGMRSGGGGRR